MDAYLAGALDDMEARIRFLKARVRPVGRENATLVRTCRERLDGLARRAQSLGSDQKWKQPANAAARFREFRILVGELDELEYVAVQVLSRWSDDDTAANILIERAAREIAYPLAAPVAACQSRQYYHVLPSLGLMLIPPAEGAFLLHLPDLYHELAHPLLTELNDPTIEPLQHALLSLYLDADGRIEVELDRERARRSAPQAFQYYLAGWRASWRSWLTEFVCDVFAAHVAGPAFAWAHLHLTAKRGGDPYAVPLGRSESHPADAARMAVLLEALELNGWGAQTSAIRGRWERMMAVAGYQSTPEYVRCFPPSLLDSIARGTVAAVERVGCTACQPQNVAGIPGVLLAAWDEFWRAPSTYSQWQQSNARALGFGN